MMVREKISGRPGQRLEEKWRERLPTKWGREREREREKNAGKREITITKETEERTIEREIEVKKKKIIREKRRN